MNIFFDIDATILSFDGHLRPGLWELLKRLKADGHTLYLWTSSGSPRAQDELDEFKLREYFAAGMGKSDTPDVRPDVVIDDDDIWLARCRRLFGCRGVQVKAFEEFDPEDRELWGLDIFGS